MRKTGRPLLAVIGISLALATGLGCAPGVAAPMVPAQRTQARTIPAYDSIAVVQPANDATVYDNAGDVEVTVAISPGLDSGAGDRIALILDGRQMPAQSAIQFTLSGLTRGEHILKAQVRDSGGKILISSSPVKFNLWQASRLFPNRRGK